MFLTLWVTFKIEVAMNNTIPINKPITHAIIAPIGKGLLYKTSSIINDIF